MHRITSLLAFLLLVSCAPIPASVRSDAAPGLELRITSAPDREAPATAGPLKVMRVAHSAVLLDLGGPKVLTDPWFSEKPGYQPGEPLGITPEQLPRLSAVVASHAHYDHFDVETFARYPHRDVPFFVGPDMVDAARAVGFTNVRELAAGEQVQVGELTITAGPGAHGSVGEITFLLEANGFRVFFAGDSLLTPELRTFARAAAPVDLILPPVNGLHAVGMQQVMNAEEAAELSGLLQAAVAVPTHYAFRGSWFTETFILSYDGTPARFVDALRVHSPATRAQLLETGQWLTIVR